MKDAHTDGQMVLAAADTKPVPACSSDPVIDQEIVDSDEAFDRLTRETSPVVYRFLVRMVGSREDAQDLAQEVFLAVYRSRRKLRAGAPALPYLLTIARRKAISLYRWRSIRSLVHPLEECPDEHLVERTPSAHDRVELGEQHRLLEKCLLRLKPNERAALALRLFEERSYEEIAQVMQKPVGTVKSTVFRAERKLRMFMEETGAKES